MKSIKGNFNHQIVINKSIFIAQFIKIEDKENLQQYMSDIKMKYKDATHYCYAYIIDEYRKCSDDGEPSGTAGIQIMESLNMANLNRVLCVVIRYFGGIKLGSGGLIRAYRKVVVEALNGNKDKIVELIDGFLVKVQVSYPMQKDFEYWIKKDYWKEYGESVVYTFECDENLKEKVGRKYHIIFEEKKKIQKD